MSPDDLSTLITSNVHPLILKTSGQPTAFPNCFTTFGLLFTIVPTTHARRGRRTVDDGTPVGKLRQWRRHASKVATVAAGRAAKSSIPAEIQREEGV